MLLAVGVAFNIFAVFLKKRVTSALEWVYPYSKFLYVGYMVGNHILRLRRCIPVKLNFRPYIRQYTSSNDNFECSYNC